MKDSNLSPEEANKVVIEVTDLNQEKSYLEALDKMILLTQDIIDAAFKKVVFTVDFPNPKIDPEDWWNSLSKDWKDCYTRLKKVLVQCVLINAIMILFLSCSFAQTNTKKAMSMETLFAELIAVKGNEYLKKEYQLREFGGDAVAMLQTKLSDQDSFTRFYARMMINWISGRSPKNQEALSYLDSLPVRLARTPITSPSPMGAMSYLNLHFQSSVTDILAVHLIKLPDFPHWRIATILFYLESQKSPEVTDILLRFVNETSNDDYRNVALNTIDATNDPNLKSKLLQEELRLKALEKELPESLKSRLLNLN